MFDGRHLGYNISGFFLNLIIHFIWPKKWIIVFQKFYIKIFYVIYNKDLDLDVLFLILDLQWILVDLHGKLRHMFLFFTVRTFMFFKKLLKACDEKKPTKEYSHSNYAKKYFKNKIKFHYPYWHAFLVILIIYLRYFQKT